MEPQPPRHRLVARYLFAAVAALILTTLPFPLNAQILLEGGGPPPPGFLSFQPALLPKPFGGLILAITACAVPAAGLLLHIGPPRGGDFLYIPGISRLFAFFSIRPGAWTLGLAGPDELGCFIRVSVRRGFILQLVGEGAPILIMGTSL